VPEMPISTYSLAVQPRRSAYSCSSRVSIVRSCPLLAVYPGVDRNSHV
jgi:hypothetical protein